MRHSNRSTKTKGSFLFSTFQASKRTNWNAVRKYTN